MNSNRAICVATLLALCSAADGQTVTQQLDLKPGWNAIFLELDPQPAKTAQVFAGVPVRSVSLLNDTRASPQYGQDPNQPTSARPARLEYRASGSINNLHVMFGGRPYMVYLGGDQPVAVMLRGVPRIRFPNWIPDEMNFVGFYVDDQSPPTFGKFFASSPAHAGQRILRLTAGGKWQRVEDPESTKMRRGEAFYVFTKGVSRFCGPTELDIRGLNEFDFNDRRDELTLAVRNRTTADCKLELNLAAAESSAVPAAVARAGDVPLNRYQDDPQSGERQYVTFDSAMTQRLGASERVEFRFAVDRRKMKPFVLPASAAKAAYHSILEVRDDQGSYFRIPVSALPLVPFARAGSTVGDAPSPGSASARLAPGLWVGQVTIAAVSEPRNPADPQLPLPTESQFHFRIILHADATGRAHLLQSVMIMFKQGRTAARSPTRMARNAEYVILTDRNRLAWTDDNGQPLYTGSALRDGVSVGRRISSANFSFREPIEMSRRETDDLLSLSCAITIPFDDPLNPLVHRFHPDHDNLDRQFQPLGEGVESFDIQRALTLNFSDVPLDRFPAAGYGSRVHDGVYQETISGLHKQPITVRGRFRVSRILDVAELNDGGT